MIISFWISVGVICLIGVSFYWFVRRPEIATQARLIIADETKQLDTEIARLERQIAQMDQEQYPIEKQAIEPKPLRSDILILPGQEQRFVEKKPIKKQVLVDSKGNEIELPQENVYEYTHGVSMSGYYGGPGIYPQLASSYNRMPMISEFQ